MPNVEGFLPESGNRASYEQPAKENIDLPYPIDSLNKHDDEKSADEAASPSSTNAGSGPVDLGQTLQKVMLMTLGVLAVAVLAMFGLKKIGWRPAAGMPSENSGAIRVLDTIQIGTRGQVQVLEIGRQRVAVATDPTGIKSMLVLQREFADEMSQAQQSLSESRPYSPQLPRS